jgi:shikimate kinase
MNIILIGYRGSGKSTIGKLLATRLWKTFVDTDEEVRKRFANKTIAEIWQEHGESEWRRAEVEVTQKVLEGANQVIALGGGTLMQPAARTAVEQAKNAVRIYLSCEPQELHRRIAQDTNSSRSRPPLTGYGGSVEEIRCVLAERDPVYRAVADKVLDVTHLKPENGLRYLIDRCL